MLSAFHKCCWYSAACCWENFLNQLFVVIFFLISLFFIKHWIKQSMVKVRQSAGERHYGKRNSMSEGTDMCEVVRKIQDSKRGKLKEEQKRKILFQLQETKGFFRKLLNSFELFVPSFVMLARVQICASHTWLIVGTTWRTCQGTKRKKKKEKNSFIDFSPGNSDSVNLK